MPTLIFFTLLLLPMHGAFALDAPSGVTDAAPVSIEADSLSYDKAAATYQALGRVHLQKGELSLTSDQVEWNTETGDAIARGEVRVVEPSGEMSASEMRFNLESGSGQLREARVFIKEHNFRLAGDEIERFDELNYRITGGSFTTCDGEKPSWKFGANRLDVTVGRYARAKHVLFYILPGQDRTRVGPAHAAVRCFPQAWQPALPGVLPGHRQEHGCHRFSRLFL